MPRYHFLLEDKLDLSLLTRKIHVMRTLGVPYTDEEEHGAVGLAEAQAQSISQNLERDGVEGMADKDAVALIAYLQRMGTDIKKGASQ